MRPTFYSTRRRRQRGAALIITVGLLAVLAVIGFGFAVLARLHNDISGAYRASAQNDLIASAAFQYAVAEIRYGWPNAPIKPDGTPAVTVGAYRAYQTGAVADPTDGPLDPWYVDATVSSQGYTGTDGFRHYCNLRCSSYALVHDELGPRVGVSNVKVLDAAGKININDREDTDTSRLQAILQYLVQKLLGYSSGEATTLVSEILTDRGTGFTTLEELRTKVKDGSNNLLIDPRVFELLKHYATIYSWPSELPVTNSFPNVVNPTGTVLTRKDSDQSTKKYYYRCPININTAGRELLYALLRSVAAADGTVLTDSNGLGEANNVAMWMVRKRKPESPDHWTNGTISGAGSADWNAWLPTLVGGADATAKYDDYLQRKFDGWSLYPMGPFDGWNEVMDFVYSLAARTNATDHPYHSASAVNDSPFPNSGVFTTDADKKAEAILAALSPNVYAADLAGYNAWHLGYSRHRRDSTWADFRDQIPRDRDGSAASVRIEPQVTGKNKLAPSGATKDNSYPLCFSSMGRHEIYSRTYTFVKADSGAATTATANSLTDSSKTWFASPSQWRGYSVVIYAGAGKGQVRGIVYVKPDISTTTGRTLVVDPWSVPLSTSGATQSRYYIVGPGAFLDRPPNAAITTPTDSRNAARSFLVSDTAATWEDGQWDGHRIVVYSGTVSSGTETIVETSIQERTIVGTYKTATAGAAGLPAKSLVLAPDLDMGLFDTTKTTGYIILGCDGVVEHSGAIKAYDVVHHTTQKDFETGRGAVASDPAQYTYAASGPANYRKADGTLLGGTVTPSPIDGWLTARRKPAAGPTVGGLIPAAPLVHNFDSSSLTPESGGTYVASNPAAADMVKDCLADANGRLLSDGIHLTGGSANYADFRLSNDLCTSSRQEGGFVSFWIRPDEALFTAGTDRTIVELYGETTATEKIALVAKDGTGANAGKRVLELQVTFLSDRLYDGTAPPGTLPDAKHKPTLTTAADLKYNNSLAVTARSHQDTTYSVIYDPGSATGWRPGEWHHVAFAWYECWNDGQAYNSVAGYNSDGAPLTDWRDDVMVAGLPDYKLDGEVAGRLRIWADGYSTALTAATPTPTLYDNEKPAFNFVPSAAGVPHVRLSGGAYSTIDGLVVLRHTDPALANATFGLSTATPPIVPPRYDPGYTTAFDATTVKYAEYQSPTISISNPGGDVLTLGTVTWTAFLPWSKEADRWAGGDASGRRWKFPIRGQAALGSTWSTTLPANSNPTDFQPVVTGGPLRNGTALVSTTAGTTSTTLQYRLYLLPRQGSDPADSPAKPGLLKGRQTPVVEDVTVTYLGPVTFYYWK